MNPGSRMNVKIFADGANLDSMLRLACDSRIQGFTTNPTLMRQAGVTDYEKFVRQVVERIPDRPISFEVFSDALNEMYQQALSLAALGENIYVKVPITNTRGDSVFPVMRALTSEGVKLNVTAIMTMRQVATAVSALEGGAPAYISVFAGRIADTGRDPVPVMRAALDMLSTCPGIELIWASPREVLNVVQADQIGCHIITVTPELIQKLSLVGKDLDDFSLETVRMFYDDACKAGFTLTINSLTEQIGKLAIATTEDPSPARIPTAII